MTPNDEYQKAKYNLEEAEKLQERMKTVNAIIRSKKNVTERLISEAGLSESNAMQIQEKDFAGRVGFSTYKLTNNNANISRLRERVNMLSDKLESAEKGNETYTFSEIGGGGTIEINYDIDRVQLLFPNGRVDNEVYKLLRKNGYVYSPTNKAFQRKITPQAISNAIYLTKATRGEVAEQRDVSLSNLTDADRQNMLENKKFSYVTGSLYNALPPSFKEYTGAKTFELVYFSTNRENVKDAIKRYFKENMPIVDIEKMTINVYTQTYIRESKLLYKRGDFMPSNTEPNVLLRLKNEINSYQNMSDRVDKEEPKAETPFFTEIGSDGYDSRVDNNEMDYDAEEEVLKDLQKYSSPKKYNSEIEVGQRYYDNRYADYYTIEKMTEVISGGDVNATLKYDKGATRTESGDFILYHIDAKQHSLSKEEPKETIETIEPNSSDEFDEIIMANIDPKDDWIGNLVKERDVKQQIYKQLSGDEQEKEAETNRIFYLYAEKNKNNRELHEMNNKNFEEIKRLKKEIANGERLMSNINFSGDVTNEINRWKKQLAELEGKENSNSGKIPAKLITLQIRDDRTTQQKYTDYDYDGANDKMRWILDNKKFSDLNYNIQFEDGETLSGVIDCEPREFFDGVSNPLTRHLNTFWGNVAKGKGAFIGAEETQQAKDLIEKYDLGEVKVGASQIEPKAKELVKLPQSIINLIDYLNKEDDAKKKAERWNEQRGLLLPKLGRTLWQIVMNVPYIEVQRSGDESRVHFSGNDLLRAIDKVYKENDVEFDQYDYGTTSEQPKAKESKPFGLTTIEYLDSGKTVTWGTKTRRGRETVIGKSNSDINEEIESLKEYIVIGEIELKKAQEQYDKVKGMGSPTMYKNVADALSHLKMIERTLYVNKNILLPFFEKNIGEGEEKSDYQKELDRQVNEGEIEDDSQGISLYHLAKNIEETTNNQFKGIHHNYKNQYVLNKAIEELLMTKDNNYSSEEKVFIRKYSGYGGLDKYGKGGKGSFFEFYTPTEIIERMWGLAYKYGYDNGSVLETSVGTGEFFRYAPKDARLVGYEISEYSGKICKILYPTAEINIQPFEKTFIKNNYTIKGRLDDLEKFSLVIGNPPYGDFSKVESRYMSGMGEKDYTHARNYVEYFIRRGMDLLESGGLLVFIVGASLQNGGTMFLDSGMSPVKKWLSENCTLETAYRLPDSVFERTGVTADIIVLKKN
jgi:hypothetical protein